MSAQYTAQQIEGVNSGWYVFHNETGKRHIVFCNENENTAEDAVALLTEEPTADVGIKYEYS